MVADFEDENGADKAGALGEAMKTVANIAWEPEDLGFYFNQAEARMQAAGVKKNFTKLQVLTTILPPHVIREVKSILSKKESEFDQNDAYKQLKTEIIDIFGPKPCKGMERALQRVLSGTPSQLARLLVNDVCKHNLDCDCCPDIILHLWKRHLPSAVRAGIARTPFSKDTFKEITALADDIFYNTTPAGAPAGVAALEGAESHLNETQPAIPYATVPEVAALRGNFRGRGRSARNRGRGRGRGAQAGGQGNTGARNKPPRHPDGPPDGCCNQHLRFGKSSHFCTEPLTCPWKDIVVPRSRSNQQ